jgi:hypothetical protein
MNEKLKVVFGFDVGFLPLFLPSRAGLKMVLDFVVI